MSKIKDLSSNFSLSLASIALTIALFEILLLLFFPQKILITSGSNEPYIKYDPEIGWTNMENFRGDHSTLFSDKEIPVRINRHGMRGKDVSIIKAPGIKRILILGDSNTFGYGITEEKTFSTLIADKLPEDYEVLNYGVFAYGTDQETLLLENKGLKFSPDIVILAFSAGDPSDNMVSINFGVNKPYFKLAGRELVLKNVPVPKKTIYSRRESPFSGLKTYLYSHSNLYRLFFNRVIASNIFARKSVQEMTNEEGMNTTLGIIRWLNDLCNSKGIRFVVLLISHGDLITAQNRMGGADAGYFPFLKMSMNRRGIQFIDPSAEMARLYGMGERTFFRKDPVHLNERGNEIVADTLYEELMNKTNF